MTLRLTLRFVAWVQGALKLDEVTVATVRSSVLSLKPSSNGYDVYSANPLPFVAEVKCNIPVNGGSRYGAAQRDGILKDVKALREGKSKALTVTPNALRFRVFADLPEVRSANAHLFTSDSAAIKFLDLEDVPTDSGVVYGVYLPIGAKPLA